MLYQIFYKSMFAFLVGGGLCFLISYCTDLINFLRKKETNYNFYHTLQNSGKTFLGAGILFGIVGSIAYCFF